MRTIPCWLALLPSLCVTGAELAQYDWRELSKAHPVANAEVITLDGRTALKVANTNQGLARIALFTIEKPPIEEARYAISGEIKYDAVAGDGYLEMWNIFAEPNVPEGRFFSRTLGEGGPMAKITGRSNWRPFLLPFDRTGTSAKPSRLEVNLVLPGPGTVYIGPLRLAEYTREEYQKMFGIVLPWWTRSTTGWIGGVGGALLGGLAAALTWLATQGKARGFVLATTKLLIALGGVLVAGTFAALVSEQPFWVSYVPAIGAVLLLLIMPWRYRDYVKRYEELELRRIRSADTGKVSA